MKKLVFGMAIVLSLAVGVSCTAGSGSSAPQAEQTVQEQTEKAVLKDMSPSELEELLKSEGGLEGAVLVDVRTAEEFASGHLKGAINIPLQDIEANVGKVEEYKDKKIILYCRSGNRSGQAGELLVANGFTDVYNAGGIKDYSSDVIEK
ncbi:MAG: rhodanese-like domain-containing protein [Filifactor alocis]|nr:rhodanese-like domain-containing protein [Filifactor alocis]